MAQGRVASAGPGGSGKPLLSLMLLSDVGLDRPCEWATPAIASSRRAAAKQALVDILIEARRRSVDVIACAGDLFDRHTVKPATMQWLVTAFRSAGVPVLIAPGNEDFLGPLGGYARHRWPPNVHIFTSERLTPLECAGDVTIWGAANRQAHSASSLLDGVRVDRGGVNIAMFHGAEAGGYQREPGLEPCAPFSEPEIEAAGFDHALLGHYHERHLGRLHVYPGAPIVHGFGSRSPRGAVVVTVLADGSLDREEVLVSSPDLYDVEVDATGSRSKAEVLRRVRDAVGDRTGGGRLRVTGRLSPDVVVKREDLVKGGGSGDGSVVVWDAGVGGELETLAREPTIRGQFVREVLDSPVLSEERRQRVLLIGLRALAGHEELDNPR
ncbi:MAG: metallophosphoesterase family protein [Actinomycetota bacterium]|nr:metallophosphoesterase family protein [Actinomycetota bacterium]